MGQWLIYVKMFRVKWGPGVSDNRENRAILVGGGGVLISRMLIGDRKTGQMMTKWSCL